MKKPKINTTLCERGRVHVPARVHVCALVCRVINYVPKEVGQILAKF